MVDRKDLLALNFYKKTDFYGSNKKMHYRIARIEREIPAETATEAAEGEAKPEPEKEVLFHVWYWPGPYCFAKTSDTLKQEADFPFSEEGLCAVADFLNEQYEKQGELWK